jgi:deoxyribonuclease V
MRIHPIHPWDVSPREAIQLQNSLRQRIVTVSNLSFNQIRRVAGADLAFSDDGKVALAGVVVFSFPDLQILERQFAEVPVHFPYIPGLLTFREGPALLEAFSKVRIEPDVIFFDGQGIAHPRGCGIASDMGLFLNKPTIGCAKSRLIGDHREPGPQPGNWSPLRHAGRIIGSVLRTKESCKPLFVSIGHRIDLKMAMRIAMACVDGHRIPKPTREADSYVARLKSDRSKVCIPA